MEDNRVKFVEMLGSITEVARVQNNHISASEIKELFGDLELSNEQYEHVHAYLLANGIVVDGATEDSLQHMQDYKPKQQIEEDTEEEQEKEEVIDEGETSAFDEEDLKAMEGNIYKDKTENLDASSIKEDKDSMYLKMYLEDLSAIKPFAKNEEQELLVKAKKQDGDSISRLIEGNLLHVVEVAKQYSYTGVPVEDLIGEGNIGLMTGVTTLDNVNTLDELKSHLEQCAREAIMAILDEEVDSSNLEYKVIERADFLNDAATKLEKELKREPNIKELSEYTKITEEDIKDILKLSGDNIKVKVTHNHSPKESK